ncbi:hypothetical protein M758_5G153100 [Ceratodon purpureus]|nr:hypothetical protein M758_5G153100 [Ceratodon purpureus]
MSVFSRLICFSVQLINGLASIEYIMGRSSDYGYILRQSATSVWLQLVFSCIENFTHFDLLQKRSLSRLTVSPQLV